MAGSAVAVQQIGASCTGSDELRLNQRANADCYGRSWPIAAADFSHRRNR